MDQDYSVNSIKECEMSMTDWLFFGGWIWLVFIQAISGAIQVFVGINITPLFYLGLLAAFLSNYKYLLRSIYKSEVIWVLIIFFCIWFTIILHPDNTTYLVTTFSTGYMFVIFYFIGKLAAQVKDIFKIIRKASMIGILLAYFAFFTSLATTAKDMSFSYAVLPHTIVVMEGMFTEKKLTFFIFSAAGGVLLFLLGTRGPLLFAMLYFLYKFVYSTKNLIINIMVVCAGILTIWLIKSNTYIWIASRLNDFLIKRNINSFILHQLLTHNTASIDERGHIQRLVLEGIDNNWGIGMGLFGDRLAADGLYAHNIILEILCEFGLPVGLLFLSVIFFYIFKVFKKYIGNAEFEILIICFFSFFLKFFISSSYISDIGFYFFVGILCGYNHRDIFDYIEMERV